MPKKFRTRPSRAIRQSTEAIKGLEQDVAAAQGGNKVARDRVLVAWLPWIEDQARLYAHRAARLDLVEDLRQTAICGAGPSLGGLMRAIETYDPNKGTPFHVHAIYTLNGEFTALLASNVPGMKQREFRLIERIRSIARDFEKAFNRRPTIIEIRRMGSTFVNGATDEKIEDALSIAEESHHPVTLASNTGAYLATVTEPRSDAVLEAKEQVDKVFKRLAKFSPRDQEIFIEMVINEGDPMYLAEKFGIAKATVGDVARKVHKKLIR